MKYCPITSKEMQYVFSAQVLGKYDVRYFYSQDSGILQTETPYWLAEAYTDAISTVDTGVLWRNMYSKSICEPILHRLFEPDGKYIDIGGGYGLLTRLMRDAGFDYYTKDEHCQNIFAKYFDAPTQFTANCLTAFEVLEHIENPLTFLQDVFNTYSTRSIIFSTVTYNNIPPNQSWWYYNFINGQHITFYQPKTLVSLAQKLGCRYYSLSNFLHLITDRLLTRYDLLLLNGALVRRIYRYYVKYVRRGMSKIWDDHRTAIQRLS